jgi:hypothetical protein
VNLRRKQTKENRAERPVEHTMEDPEEKRKKKKGVERI